MIDLILATEADPPQIDWLTPVTIIAGPVLVAIVGLIGSVWRRRQDRQEQKEDQQAAKSLNEKDEYTEIDRARREALRYYDLFVLARNGFDFVQTALRHLVRSVRERHPDHEFNPEVLEALAMNTPSAGDK